MQKGVKFTLYVILILVIIAVVCFIFGTKNLREGSTINTEIETLTGEEIINNGNNGSIVDLGVQNYTFEEDVMNDLEGFFSTNNGYENIEGEFGFTSPENE